ncbi:uncharacterized protein YjbJ (UPF0337 family) [Loktanella ponticola]|uniref:Uncharacterized protein YjbJ (UPF0337 family) n=1 Tax=Yoonia ponticola TaxID=1524255 RepID=A0A7W9BJW4_9RHOB|nr:hypothetical protein [Yoonia ponticola]MBB5721592.1 uncharacterized protein YjbJ (UPF0337 family) [Yoonia ponticola]
MTTTDNSNFGADKSFGEKAKEATNAATKEIKAGAQGVAENVAAEAENYAGQAKSAAADEVGGVASALRTAAEEMRSGSPQERTFSQIADGLADASDAMRDKDMGEMVGAVSDFAKRNPMVFLGGAALLGFAATRFAKASSDSQSGYASNTSSHNQNARPAAPTGAVQSPTINRPHEGGNV